MTPRVAALGVALAVASTGLLEKNHPAIEAGRKAWEAGRYDEALRQYEAVLRERPGDAAVLFNQGTALLKLGRPSEAERSFGQALEVRPPPPLEAQLRYNLALALEAQDKLAAAKAQYRKALQKNPQDVQARDNLERLLKKPPPPPSDGGTPDAGHSDAGTPDAGRPDAGPPDGGPPPPPPDAGSPDSGTPDAGPPPDGGSGDGGTPNGLDGGAHDAGPPDAGGGDGGQPQGQRDGGSVDGGGGSRAPSDGGNLASDGGSSDGGSARPQEPGRDGGLSPEEARALLNSLKNQEKTLSPWRFQKKQKVPHEKDW